MLKKSAIKAGWGAWGGSWIETGDIDGEKCVLVKG